MTALGWIALGFLLGVIACVAYSLCAVRSLYRSAGYFDSEDSTNNKD